MKLLRVSLLFTLLATLGSAQVIQDFSSTISPNTYFYGSWELNGSGIGSESPNASFIQGSGVYDITGATANNSDLSKFEIFFDPPTFSIGTNQYLEVKAQALSLNAATSFQVVLVDSAAKTALASFDATSFLIGSYSLAHSQLTFQSGFNSNAIESLIVTGGVPSGSARFNFSFDEIKAVAIPEPSTYAAIVGALALGLVAYRRRRVAA